MESLKKQFIDAIYSLVSVYSWICVIMLAASSSKCKASAWWLWAETETSSLVLFVLPFQIVYICIFVCLYFCTGCVFSFINLVELFLVPLYCVCLDLIFALLVTNRPFCNNKFDLIWFVSSGVLRINKMRFISCRRNDWCQSVMRTTELIQSYSSHCSSSTVHTVNLQQQ